MRSLFAWPLACLAVMLGGCGGDPADGPPECPTSYGAVLLPAPPLSSSSAEGLNEAGDVVGEIDGDAVRWSGGSVSAVVNTFGGLNSIANAVDESGRIVGSAETAVSGRFHPFLSVNGVMTDLGTLGGDNGFASGVNAAGDVVGKAQTGGNAATHAFLVQNGSMSDLGTLGGTASGAADINAAGRIVGSSDIAGNAETHAFIHEAGVMRDLGTLGGSESRALAVNDAGHVVGSSFPVGSTDDHAFFYRDGQMVDLYPGGSAIARGLNNRDHVVGRMRAAASPTGWHAFRYCGGTVIDLNQLLPAGAGLELVDASDINDSGAIVGVAVPASSTLQRAYMLTPS